MAKIVYIANVRLPTEKAHGVQIMEMCMALSECANTVELVVPKRKNKIKIDAFSYYNISDSFKITHLPSFDVVRFGKIGFLIQTFTFIFSTLRYIAKKDTILYSRDSIVLFFLSFFKKAFLFEVHAPEWNFVTRRVVSKARFIFPISKGLQNFFITKGISADRMKVLSDGVDLRRFMISKTKEECRDILSLPYDKTIVLYSGHLYERKGAHLFGEIAKSLGSNVLCVFVGGLQKDVLDFRAKYSEQNVLILGHKSYNEIPLYLASADVLVLPNSAMSPDSSLYTSPMKLFEYMASGRPIVASRVPALLEVLSDKDAYFFESDNSQSLKDTILKAIKDKETSLQISRQAKEDVSQYSFQKRALIVNDYLY